jgi:hypothetical protein
MSGTPPDLVKVRLDAERLGNARRLLLLRAVLTATFLVWTAVAAFQGVTGAQARLPIVIAYCAIALLLYGASRKRAEVAFHSWLALAVIDIPMVYGFQRLAIQQPPAARR